jgi:hypothetical protein
LSIERGFKYGEDGILQIVGQSDLLSLSSGVGYGNQVGLSIESFI